MLTNKLHIAAFTLLSFAAAACSNSVEHYIADVDAPGFVSVSPAHFAQCRASCCRTLLLS